MRLQERADLAAMADAPDVQMRRRFYGGKTGEIAMKPEMEKGLRAADIQTQVEIVELLAEIMPPGKFVDALLAEDLTLTDDGEKIAVALPIDHDELVADFFGDDIHRLHDAICEGRRQDAVDILASITGEKLRSVSAQHNLFPERVPA